MKRIIFVFLCLSVLLRADEALVKVSTWEVIIVKPDNSVWSNVETNGQFYSVQWVENEFKFPSDPNASLVFPYAVYSNHVVVITQELVGASAVVPLGAHQVIAVYTSKVLVTQSEYQINPTAKSKKDKKLKKNSANFNKNIKP